MPHADRGSLWDSVSAVGHRAERTLWGVEASVRLGELVGSTSLGGRLEELRARSVLVATVDQLTAALALIELDGVASRLVLCPPDLPVEHVPFVMATAAGDPLLSDRAGPGPRAPRWAALLPRPPPS